jgi:hypothetical protein
MTTATAPTATTATTAKTAVVEKETAAVAVAEAKEAKEAKDTANAASTKEVEILFCITHSTTVKGITVVEAGETKKTPEGVEVMVASYSTGQEVEYPVSQLFSTYSAAKAASEEMINSKLAALDKQRQKLSRFAK